MGLLRKPQHPRLWSASGWLQLDKDRHKKEKKKYVESYS